MISICSLRHSQTELQGAGSRSMNVNPCKGALFRHRDQTDRQCDMNILAFYDQHWSLSFYYTHPLKIFCMLGSKKIGNKDKKTFLRWSVYFSVPPTWPNFDKQTPVPNSNHWSGNIAQINRAMFCAKQVQSFYKWKEITQFILNFSTGANLSSFYQKSFFSGMTPPGVDCKWYI